MPVNFAASTYHVPDIGRARRATPEMPTAELQLVWPDEAVVLAQWLTFTAVDGAVSGRHNRHMAIMRRSDGERRPVPFWLAGVLIVAAMAVCLVFGANNHGLARLGLTELSETAATRYFRALGAPPGAGSLTDFREHDRDGMQNEAASGSYRVPLPQAAVLGHYRAACRSAGLTTPASAETRAYYPTAICDGPAIVTVTPRCDGKACVVFVEVIG